MMKKDAKQKNQKDDKKVIKEIIPYIILIVAVVIIRTYVITPIKVNGTSMTDTLQDGDTMILNKISKNFKSLERFQIVVIKSNDSYLIKRIIGLPGETIEYNNGVLYINGKKMKDPYFKNNNTLDFEAVKIDKNSYFVMGDNRSNSIDSRMLGTIEKKDILGTTKLIVFPISDFGIVK